MFLLYYIVKAFKMCGYASRQSFSQCKTTSFAQCGPKNVKMLPSVKLQITDSEASFPPPPEPSQECLRHTSKLFFKTETQEFLIQSFN